MTFRRFGVMPRRPLATPLPVLPLIRAALDLPEAAWAERDGDKDELAQVGGIHPPPILHFLITEYRDGALSTRG